MSLIIKSASGIEGQVELVGMRAVPGVFLRWSIERRGENRSVDPSWTLRAVFSYQKDSLLLNGMKKRIKIRFPKGSWYELVPEPGVSPRIEDDRYVVDGVKLCLLGEGSRK